MNALPSACIGEKCRFCWEVGMEAVQAKHKVEEVVMDDDPQPCRHPLATYLCGTCFSLIMGIRP